jgi:hypothetical protein
MYGYDGMGGNQMGGMGAGSGMMGGGMGSGGGYSRGPRSGSVGLATGQRYDTSRTIGKCFLGGLDLSTTKDSITQYCGQW